MPLDLLELSSQVRQMGEQLARRRADEQQRLDLLEAMLLGFCDRWEELAELAESLPERVAVPCGPLDEHVPPGPRPARYTALASDGAEIDPDRHGGSGDFYLINVGRVRIPYGQPEREVELRSVTSLGYTDEDLFIVDPRDPRRQVPMRDRHLDALRTVEELRALGDLAEAEVSARRDASTAQHDTSGSPRDASTASRDAFAPTGDAFAPPRDASGSPRDALAAGASARGGDAADAPGAAGDAPGAAGDAADAAAEASGGGAKPSFAGEEASRREAEASPVGENASREAVEASPVDAKPSRGEPEASPVGEKASRGGAEASPVGENASPGGAETSRGGEKASRREAETSCGGEKASRGGVEASCGAAEASRGELEASGGDAGQAGAVALVDGTLLFSVLEERPRDFLRTRFYTDYVQQLDRLKQARVPVAAYASRSRGVDLIHLFRAVCGSLPLACEVCQGAHACALRGLNDAHLLGRWLERWERSGLFRVRSNVHDPFYGQHRVYFFLLNTGDEFARVEVPEWVARDRKAIDFLHAVLVDQCQKGFGYPAVLARADDRAVISLGDRGVLETLVQQALARQGVVGRPSAKLARKQVRTV